MSDLEGKRAIIYLRVSDPKQVENTSLENQEEQCRRFCDSQGMKIVAVNRKEGISADAGFNIKELEEYIHRNHGKFDVLVVYHSSRFGRDYIESGILRWKIMHEKYGLLLRSATEPLGESPTERAMEAVGSIFNEWENRLRKQRAIEGMSTRIKQGLWPWKPPLAYYLPKEPGKKLCVAQIDSKCSSDVADIFVLFATGNYSYQTLAMVINDRKIVNYAGKGIKIYDQAIHRILKNKFYIGILENAFDGQTYKGQHQPLISFDLWDRVQAVIAGKLTKSRKIHQENFEFPLRGYICHTCGSMYTGAGTTKSNGSRYPYYFCGKCRAPCYPVDDVHDKFVIYLGKLTPKRDNLKLFFEIVKEHYANQVERQSMLKTKQEAELERLLSRRQRMKEGFLEGILSQEDAAKEKVVLEYQLETVKNASLKLEEVDINDATAKAEAFLLNLPYRFQDGTPPEKKMIAGSIFPGGVTFDGENYRTDTLPLVMTYSDTEKLRKLQKGEPTFAHIKPIIQDLRGLAQANALFYSLQQGHAVDPGKPIQGSISASYRANLSL